MCNFKPKILNFDNLSKYNTKIYCKNLLMFILFLEQFSKNKSTINFIKFVILKKKKRLSSFLRAPNRYKKASISLKLERYFFFLTLKFDFFLKKELFNINMFYLLIVFLESSFNFFESSLIYMKKKKILITFPINNFLMLNYK